MPIKKSVKKTLRRSRKQAVYNKRIKQKVKKLIREFKKAPQDKKLAPVCSAIDKAVKKNIFHKNKGARLKSQLSKLLKKTKTTKMSKKK